jgi:hypothetical protein
MPLTFATFKTCFSQSGKRKGSLKEKHNSTDGSDQNLELTIKRKPTQYEMRPLPNNRETIDKLKQIKKEINEKVEKYRQITVEEMRNFVKNLSSVDFELPRHLLEPLFNCCSKLISRAIETNNLYTLEILLDTISYLGARNVPGEEKHKELAAQA